MELPFFKSPGLYYKLVFVDLIRVVKNSVYTIKFGLEELIIVILIIRVCTLKSVFTIVIVLYNIYTLT